MQERYIHPVPETVILPLTGDIAAIQLAVHQFIEQYGVTPVVEIRGSIFLEGEQRCRLADWRRIGGYDLDLGLLGLIDAGSEEEEEEFEDEELLWIQPTSHGELCISSHW